MKTSALLLGILFFTQTVLAQHEGHHGAPPAGPAGCGDMQVWDFSMAMCMPRAMAGMPMRMLMVHGNAFGVQSFAEDAKGRGRNAFAAPNMFMADLGTSVGDRHYVNLDFMGTLERWTFPKDGYPELLQIGEENENHRAYLDAQHPHSSPVMGLTLSDTISLGEGHDHLKFWFAPRGQASEGPVAFMHRPTGMVNPDAPLGHHIGQDVGHIASTVAGGLVHFGESTFEVSAFNGTEPQPAKVDLPMAKLNSLAARATYEFSPRFFVMTSAAHIRDPEPHDPTLEEIWRYSVSLYNEAAMVSGWRMHNTFIYGLVNGYDHAAALNSLNEEFWFSKERKNIWGRVEYLQRTAGQLQIVTPDLNKPEWITAVTLGYTHKIWQAHSMGAGVGASVTADFLPPKFRAAYGGDPVGGKIFLQISGMNMWEM